MRRVFLSLITVLLLSCNSPHMPAQQVSGTPGQYDFYVLNLAWSPEFCDTLKTLTPAEQAARTGTGCAAPRAFAVHGLWPQNNDGTYPASCSRREGLRNWETYLGMTPDIDLLKHEWFKHGTCTTLSPQAYFSTARLAYEAVVIPHALRRLNEPLTLSPGTILQMFQTANPDFPQGSFAVACSENRFTAIEACFDRQVQPIACRNVNTCSAASLTVRPEPGGQIVR